MHVEQVSLQEQIDKLTRDKAQLAALTVEKEALQAEAKKVCCGTDFAQLTVAQHAEMSGTGLA